MAIKKRSSEVDELQKEWGSKPCNHDVGHGHEIDDATGCDCDCFCLRCGMRYADPDFFKERAKNKCNNHQD